MEDERLVARDLERRLQRLGYAVVAQVASGLEAIQQTLAHRPHLVLMDIRLQGEMDGIETARFIRTHLNTRVVFMSAYVDEATLKRAQATHPAAFLTKPFSEPILRHTLQQLLCR